MRYPAREESSQPSDIMKCVTPLPHECPKSVLEWQQNPIVQRVPWWSHRLQRGRGTARHRGRWFMGWSARANLFWCEGSKSIGSFQPPREPPSPLLPSRKLKTQSIRPTSSRSRTRHFRPSSLLLDRRCRHQCWCLPKETSSGLSSKWDQPYSQTIGWLRAKLSFALLRSSIFC